MIENDPDLEDPIRPISISAPKKYSSRGTNLRLVMLVGMFGLVLFLMYEAGKPKNWQWMNFPDSPPTANESDTADRSKPDSSPNDLATNAPTETPSLVIRSENQPANRKPTRPPATVLLSAGPDTDAPSAVVEFWDTMLPKLSDQQLADFLRLLKSIRRGKQLPADRIDAFKTLANILSQQRDEFHQRLFDKLALAKDGDAEKSRRSQELNESIEAWDKNVFPAIKAIAESADYTVGQQQSVVRLQSIIDPLLNRQVQDTTAIGWPGDGESWKRIWEQVALDSLPPTAEPVDWIQLISQPEFYRGQLITVKGKARICRRKDTPSTSELDVDHYYELWITPPKSSDGPYCIYTANLPPGFRAPTQEFSELDGQQVEVTGYFFKVRTYVATGQTVENCPVIIAPTFATLAVAQLENNPWQPSTTTLATFFSLIPVAAVLIAWWVFRSSRTRPYVPGKKTQSKIKQTLDNLADDPRVQTDIEKINALYETESSVPSREK